MTKAQIANAMTANHIALRDLLGRQSGQLTGPPRAARLQEPESFDCYASSFTPSMAKSPGVLCPGTFGSGELIALAAGLRSHAEGEHIVEHGTIALLARAPATTFVQAFVRAVRATDV